MKDRHNDAKNIFSFNAYGSIVNVRLGFLDQIYIFEGIAATVLQIVEEAERQGFKDNTIIDDGDRYNFRSQNEYLDWYVERYTNYGNQGGCLERILYAYGHFIYDLIEQVTTMGKQGDELFIINREAHYVGLPCHGTVDKRGIEIFTDALDALQRYEDLCEKYAPNSSKRYYTWTDNNKEFLKLFGIDRK